MTKRPSPRDEVTQPARPRWQVTIFQLLFGVLAVALGGLISAEPMLSLERLDDGRLECRYALDAYGSLPLMKASVDDLVRYEVTESEVSVPRGASSSSPMRSPSYGLRLIGRDGSSFTVGQTWDLIEIDHMIEGGPEDRSHSERIAAGKGRRLGGLALGAFGLLLLAGAVWNLLLMVTGFGSPKAEIGHG